MTPAGETYAALTGTWLLARRQRAGLAFFNATREGFAHSFWAVALMVPFGLAIEAAGGLFSGPAGVLRPLIVLAIGYVVSAVAFPLVTAGITAEMGKGHRWVLFVVAYNWSTVLRTAAFFPAAMLTLAAPQLHPLLAGVMVVLLVYQAYIAHVTLEISPLMAGGLVLLDLLLDKLIGFVALFLITG